MESNFDFASDLLKGMLYSSTQVSVVLTDLDQTVRFWNKGAENIFGYTAEEMIGAKVTKLYPHDEVSADVTIFSLAKPAESRDEETGLHPARIQEYCRALSKRLAARQHHQEQMTPEFIDDLIRSSVLHDIGKVAIPDSVLNSREKFKPEDVAVMRRHPLVGGKALEDAEKRLGERSFLSIGSDVAYYHHEHWDGGGYPFGFKGQEIPLSARMVAIADVYDALTTERRYKRSFSHEEAFRIIVDGKGKQFDPELVEVFQELEAEFKRIRDQFSKEDLARET
jgi:response regulator RpfG family c-di-GMP phosphodiesterase